MATYVIQQPHSNTNRSSNYRVVSFDDWRKAADEGVQITNFKEFASYEAAEFYRDSMNDISES